MRRATRPRFSSSTTNAPPPANAVINVDIATDRRRMNHWFTAAISVCPKPALLPREIMPENRTISSQ